MTGYLYDQAWRKERERLAGIESLFDAGTVRHLTDLGVSEGWRCLEIGAGGGSIAEWLAERVGPSGSVVATDLDTRFVEAVAAPNLEARVHDIAVDPLEESAFDLAHARMLIEHVGDRASVLKRIASSLRPGGWALIEDVDFTDELHLPAKRFFGGPPARTRILSRTARAILTLMQRVGFDPTFGRRLPEELESAGFTDVGAETRGRLVRGGTPETTFFRFSLEALGPRLIETGLASERDVARALTALDSPDIYYVSPVIVAAWGRRPA